MKKRKVLTSILALLLAAVTAVPAAAVIPGDYWALHGSYLAAVEAGNEDEILRLAAETERVFAGQEMDPDKAGILLSRYQKAAEIYERRGRYDQAAEALAKYIECARFLGFDDSVKLATARLRMMDPGTEVYALTDEEGRAVDYGMRAEPKYGAYYGRAESEDGRPLESFESGRLFYVEFMDESVANYDYLIRPVAESGCLVEIALNMPRENASLYEVMSDSALSYIDETMTYLAGLPCPVLLRIGGEMNVWTDLAEAELFRSAYIRIAQRARALAPQVGLVFSPNDVSNWNVDIDDYYPGDEWVDWVGVSLYTNRTPEGGAPAADAEPYYGTGDYALAIKKLRDIVGRYGDRKPIAVTEGGFGHSRYGTGEDFTARTLPDMTEFYRALPAVYPQVKAVFCFDVRLGDYGAYDYTVSRDAARFQAYSSAQEGEGAYIHGNAKTSAGFYVPLDGYDDDRDTLSLMAVCMPKQGAEVRMELVVDGQVTDSATAQAHSFEIAASDLVVGRHSVVVRFASDACGYSAEQRYLVERTADGRITARAGDPAQGEAPSAWAVEELRQAERLGLLPAALAGNYGKNITRADFCALVLNLMEKKSGKTGEELATAAGKIVDPAAFTDTSDRAVLCAAALGVVGGIGDGLFAPDASITRQEAAVMLSRAASALGVQISGESEFADADEIADWAKAGVGYVASARSAESGRAVMGGVEDGKFAPKSHYTREQAVLTMVRLFGAIK